MSLLSSKSNDSWKPVINREHKILFRLLFIIHKNWSTKTQWKQSRLSTEASKFVSRLARQIHKVEIFNWFEGIICWRLPVTSSEKEGNKNLINLFLKVFGTTMITLLILASKFIFEAYLFSFQVSFTAWFNTSTSHITAT